MKIEVILLVTFCLVESLLSVNGVERGQDVGGDYGRGWLSRLAPGASAQNDETDLFSWGGTPKGYNNTTGNVSDDWLNTSMLGGTNLTKNKTSNVTEKIIPYHISQTFNPIHEIDSSFNQSIQVPGLPQPDKYGMINGIPAEIYYAIGPAYFDF